MKPSTKKFGTSLRQALAASFLVATAAAGLLVTADTASAAAPNPAGTTSQAVSPSERQASTQYWTASRMSSAVEAPGSMPTADDQGGSGRVAAPEGKPGSGLPATGPPHAPKTSADPESSSSRPAAADTAASPAATTPSYYSYAWNGATNQLPATISGRLFFNEPSDSYQHFCSATVVNTTGKNMLFTAGHCVYTPPLNGNAGGYNSNVVFCPGYRNNSCPYGQWTAERLVTTTGWQGSGSFRYDMGVVLMAPINGVEITNWVGGAAITWNQAYSTSTFWYDFGYPYDPWNGYGPYFPAGASQNLWTCASYSKQWGYPATQYGAADNGPATIGIGCNMTGGASGGGWMRGSANGVLNGINSYKPTTGGQEQLFSPYFGDAAKNLYTGYQNG